MERRQKIGLAVIGVLVGLLLVHGIALDHVQSGGDLAPELEWLKSQAIALTVPAALLTMIFSKLTGFFLP